MNLEAIELMLGKGGTTDPKELSPLALAYIGDAVYEMMVRTTVLTDGNMPVNRLHKRARDMVNAKAQAEFYYRIADGLTEEEAAVFRRGRNAKSYTTPKNADLMDYRHATGVEAIFGYLYLAGQMERAVELFRMGMAQEIEK
ncbi:ribonuclease III [Anaerotignum lactatifermentans]|uniref:Mini-ribonuclease 3 n=1 Tax=Anaerotignum lactatifermentans TaxID=160404 RepID=A0ABS2GDW6_9FIRM|nr:ribonuclease III domain-containing protein [Anaerotignum lactatifermentans]MBM6830360.1 ribonuclease III [Anaerotignum lactatifermentans]MBM6878905.1 ribonuclease III [Anaerotignum lactatifermentans]MBM6951921.1 ribonuclease III [Anaerotignum lactatifermentans]